MKCPVCKMDVEADVLQCPECGFNEINPTFVNIEEAKHWTNTVAEEYRKQYWKTLVDFEIDGTTLCKYHGDLRLVSIPYGITALSSLAFESSDVVERIIVPSTVECIPENMFTFCKMLSSVILCEGVKTIEWGAFGGWSKLKSLSLPNSIENIAEGFCYSDRNLIKMQVKEDNARFYVENNCLIDKATETLLYSWGSGNVSVPSTVKRIGRSAFSKHGIGDQIASVILPEGIQSIGRGSRIHCINIPSTVSHIEDRAFARVDNISISPANKKYKLINNCIVRIDNHVLLAVADRDCEYVIIPDCVEEIYPQAFYGCRNISKVYLPQSVIRICRAAFELRVGQEVAFFCEFSGKPEKWDEKWITQGWNEPSSSSRIYWKGQWHYEPMPNT